MVRGDLIFFSVLYRLVIEVVEKPNREIATEGWKFSFTVCLLQVDCFAVVVSPDLCCATPTEPNYTFQM